MLNPGAVCKNSAQKKFRLLFTYLFVDSERKSTLLQGTFGYGVWLVLSRTGKHH